MPRLCPCCPEQVLDLDHFQDQEVDICPSCGGIWFDEGELAATLRLYECFRGVRLDEEDIDDVPTSDRARKLRCPVDGAGLEPQTLGAIVVDICPECGGTWTDRGEVVARTRTSGATSPSTSGWASDAVPQQANAAGDPLHVSADHRGLWQGR